MTFFIKKILLCQQTMLCGLFHYFGLNHCSHETHYSRHLEGKGSEDSTCWAIRLHIQPNPLSHSWYIFVLCAMCNAMHGCHVVISKKPVHSNNAGTCRTIPVDFSFVSLISYILFHLYLIFKRTRRIYSTFSNPWQHTTHRTTLVLVSLGPIHSERQI